MQILPGHAIADWPRLSLPGHAMVRNDGGASGAPPVLALSSGSITVTAAGYPAPPSLTNTDGTITAEAA